MNMRKTYTGIAGVIAVMLAAALAVGCGKPGEEAGGPSVVTETAVADPIVRGKASFEKYCANCHGAEARGDGPLAELLKVPPADLTRLTVKYGSYPVDLVYQTIDGREAKLGHGTREMPVWGNVWTDQDGGADAETRIARQINEIVEYLRTLQVSDGG